jgi:hypothetical protein
MGPYRRRLHVREGYAHRVIRELKAAGGAVMKPF